MTARSPLCFGNVSKDFSVDNMKKTGFYRYLYDFSVDYDATAIDDILDIHQLFDEIRVVWYKSNF